MLLSLLSVATVVYGQECVDAENIFFLGVNPRCNNAGKCIEGSCYCCEIDEKTLLPKIYEPETTPDCPFWDGGMYLNGDTGPCNSQRTFASVRWKYYFPTSSSFKCAQTANQNALLENISDFYNTHGYGGTVVFDVPPPHCRVCTPSNPCRFYTLGDGSKYDDHTDGIEFSVGTDLHTFYDPACFDAEDPIPATYNSLRCPENRDDGYLAYQAFARVRTYNPAEPNAWNGPGTADMIYLNDQLDLGITESNFTPILNYRKTSIRTLSPTPAPSPSPTTPFPTPDPSANPTDVPTTEPTIGDMCFSLGYTNKLEDTKYMGNGASCRGGIKREWPGGQSCDSPYIVCLPEANTPNQSPKNPYFGTDHMYTVDQCLFECTWDQRCRGFEFNAKNGGNTGDCILIDDLPLEIEGAGSYTYDPSDSDLEQHGSLCFQKEDYCNPFFEADDLDQTMLDCYCPNNRKGFYTKKVKRVVANYKFCENDAEVDERIKQAGANRMWHLCENWCLFNTFIPEQESWYWNPWKKCWREQYAGTGAHRSYCNRVIRNPDTIEQYFINYRTNNFCDPFSQVPTKAPSDLPTTWYLAQEEQSCTDACEERSLTCHDEATAALGETASNGEMDAAFGEAGTTCTKYDTAKAHYAAPALKISDGTCLKRSAVTEGNTGCQWATGVGYQRLCACA